MTTRLTATTLAALMAGVIATGNVALAQDSPAARKVDDVTLVTRIKTDLLESDRVEGLSVNVDAKQGHVTLSGYAEDDSERDHAENIARGTEGVKSVENRIQLKTQE